MGAKRSGKDLSVKFKEEIANDVSELKSLGIVPKVTVVLATDDPAAINYASNKSKVAVELGIEYSVENIGAKANDLDILTLIKSLNEDKDNHGILLEFPLNRYITSDLALNSIDPLKDIDGLSAFNLGMIAMGNENDAILPATPQACIALAEQDIELIGKKVAVVGRGRTVGRPLLNMLINRGATVVVCHTKTLNLSSQLKDCDIVFVAIGSPYGIDETHLPENQIVIDAGINFLNGKIVGDVSPAAYDKVKAYTPVPGGVGIVTSTLIFKNLIKAVKLQNRRNG